MLKKILYASLLLILPCSSIITQTNQSISKIIKEHSQKKLLKHSSWGLYARYLDNGKEIISHNADLSLAPASGLKIFTSSAALNYLGEDFQFVTELYYDGELIANELNGNIYIAGGGDPTLGSDLVKGSLPLDSVINKIVSRIKKLGINKINGSVVADNLLYDPQPIPDHWEYIDIGNYYGASSSALTINDNLYYLYFKPAKKVGDLAEILRIEPGIPNLVFQNYMRTGEKSSGDNGYIYCAPGQFNADLRGTIPAGVEEFSIKGSIPDPPLFAVQYLTGKLNEAGIKVNGEPKKLTSKIEYEKSKLILQILSPPLKEIVYVVNKRSNNLYTELLLKAIAYHKFGVGNTGKGIELIEQFLKSSGINTDGLSLVDGCGLSRANMITPGMMVELLSFNTKRNYFNAFYNSLALVGDPEDIGFFSNMGRGTGIEKNAKIKSGVIFGVRSYSGYLKDRKGRTIVFSFIANNFNGSGSSVSNIHKELMIELAKLN